jgi:hypothetical protein
MEPACQNCGANPTIDAHIIPAAFFRYAREGNNHLVAPGSRGAPRAKTQLGLFDREILCSPCDGAIGNLDKYAIEYCKGFKISRIYQAYQIIKFENLDVDRIKRFAVAVILRAAISKLDQFSATRLDSYEEIAKQIVFGRLLPDNCNTLHVQINLLTHESEPVTSFVTYPVLCRNENGPYHIFLAGGFQFLVRFGARPFVTGRHRVIADKLALHSSKPPIGVVYPFVDAGEFEIARLSKSSGF